MKQRSCRLGDRTAWALFGASIVTLGLSLFTALAVFSAGLDFDPNDYPGSYYLEEISHRSRVTSVGVAVPCISMAAAAGALLGRPHRTARTVGSLIVLTLGVLVSGLSLAVGLSGIERARYFSELYPG